MLLIKNVKIIDGSGQPAYPGDILISGDKISAIGTFPAKKAETVIDGLGCYATPGFIDVYSEADHFLKIFSPQYQEELLKDGITTVIGGHGGSSLAPLIYGSLKSIRKWTDVNQVNINWQSFAEFAATANQLPLQINFASLIGHSTIRRDILGEKSNDPTESEIRVMKYLLEQSLKEGAVGMSSGLNYIHARIASFKELRDLVSIVAQQNKVYTTHLRNEKEGLINSINEIVNIYKNTGAKTVITRFLPFLKQENDFSLAQEIIQKSGDRFFFVASAKEFSLNPLYNYLPPWAQIGGLEEMQKIISDPHTTKQIIKELVKVRGDEIIFDAPEHKYLAGKTLKDFSQNRELSLGAGLLELMKITGLKALISQKDLNPELTEEALFDKKSLISAPIDKYLELADKKRLPRETTIAKITSNPAQFFNLKNRGLIKENYFADIVLIRDNKIYKVLVGGGERGRFLSV